MLLLDDANTREVLNSTPDMMVVVVAFSSAAAGSVAAILPLPSLSSSPSSSSLALYQIHYDAHPLVHAAGGGTTLHDIR